MQEIIQSGSLLNKTFNVLETQSGSLLNKTFDVLKTNIGYNSTDRPYTMLKREILPKGIGGSKL